METKNNEFYLNKCKTCGNVPSINIDYEKERLKIKWKCSCGINDNIESSKEFIDNEKAKEDINQIDIDKIVKKIQDTNELISLKNNKILSILKEYNTKNNDVNLLKDIIKNINTTGKYEKILDKLDTLKSVLIYEDKILALFKNFKNYKLVNQYPILTKDGIKNEIFVNENDKNDYYYNLNLDSDEKHLKEDAVKKPAYDNDEKTLFKYKGGNLSYTYILVDKEVIGKEVSFKTSGGYKWIAFYNQEKEIFAKDTRALDFSFKIPENSTKMCFYCNEGAGCYQMKIK